MLKNIQLKPPATPSFQQLYALQPKGAVDLSLSENPLGCSPLVVGGFKRLKPNFNSYPDPQATSLRKALAGFFKCRTENIFVGNGSESIIPALCRILVKPGEEIIMPQVTFPMFLISGKLAEAKVIEVPMTDLMAIDLRGIKKRITKRTKVIFICNPNNPTGDVIDNNRLLDFINKIPKRVTVIVDEANIEFGGESLLPQSLRLKNVIILRTLSKAFGLAALRVGFAIGDTSIIRILKEVTPVFPISSFSQQLAKIAVQDKAFLVKTKKFIREQREFLSKELTQLGFTVFPSQANNLFVKLPKDLEPVVFLNFLDKESISLVKGEAFSRMNNSFFRVSPRSENINKKFILKIKKLFKV